MLWLTRAPDFRETLALLFLTCQPQGSRTPGALGQSGVRSESLRAERSPGFAAFSLWSGLVLQGWELCHPLAREKRFREKK